MELLAKIQRELKVPKNQFNAFAKYHYRNCEDILEAVKPLLGNNGTLTLSDEIVQLGDRFYVKATAALYGAAVGGSGGNVSVTAYAREALDKKGMDEAQITGAASSYARKYALCGLFAIDDANDADSQDNTKKEEPKAAPAKKPAKPKSVEIAQQKEQIRDLLLKVTQRDLKTKQDFEDVVFELYALDLKEENYEQIIRRLKEDYEHVR
jgi:hypothetical protein